MRTVIFIVGLAIAGFAIFQIYQKSQDSVLHAVNAQEASEAAASGEYERGPNNGRMLRQGDFALEMTIFEDGVPPEYHVYAYEDGKPVPPQNVKLTVKLHRLDGEVNTFNFAPAEEYLGGDGMVTEPHSFDVEVTASYDGKSYQWKYASYEGRVQISDDVAKASGIEIEKSGPAMIKDNHVLSGQIALNSNATANVRARFPGIVRDVKKGLGDTVEKGEILAVVESNDSLQLYNVTAPISGTVLSRDTNIGDVAGDAPLFRLSDLSTVWAELHVFPGNMAAVKSGQDVEVSSLEGGHKTKGKIASLLPIAENLTQTIVARIPLENPDGAWRAGMNVQGIVTVAENEAPLAVKTSGLQRFRDFTVVFAKVGETYEVRMLELGKEDGTYVEVLEGIKPGTDYVTGNSFLIRADVEKSAASHDH